MNKVNECLNADLTEDDIVTVYKPSIENLNSLKNDLGWFSIYSIAYPFLLIYLYA